MARQYGQPDVPDFLKDPNKGYGTTKPMGAGDATPQSKQQDPTPDNKTVTMFHRNASVDTRQTDIHHTLGADHNQASPGDHKHDGGDSIALLAGINLTGAKGGNSALASVIAALVKLGAKDNTTA